MKKRIHTLDEIRGFSIICMIFYHAFYSLTYIFHIHNTYILLNFFRPYEPIFAGIFILISGISSRLSHSNIKRGIKLLFISILVSLVTYIFIPSQLILFGILHMLSFCMIIFGLLKPIFNKIPRYIGMISCFILFLLSINTSINIQNNFIFSIFIKNYSFFSTDYFPILPWIFVFLFGTFIGKFAEEENFPKFMYIQRCKFLSFMGKHALIIYLIHQPIIYGLMQLLVFLGVNKF